MGKIATLIFTLSMLQITKQRDMATTRRYLAGKACQGLRGRMVTTDPSSSTETKIVLGWGADGSSAFSFASGDISVGG